MNSEKWVVDATKSEATVKTAELMVGMNPFKEVCSIVKPGGIDIEMDQLFYLCNVAFDRVCELMKDLQEQIKADIQLRNIETNSFAKKRK